MHGWVWVVLPSNQTELIINKYNKYQKRYTFKYNVQYLNDIILFFKLGEKSYTFQMSFFLCFMFLDLKNNFCSLSTLTDLDLEEQNTMPVSHPPPMASLGVGRGKVPPLAPGGDCGVAEGPCHITGLVVTAWWGRHFRDNLTCSGGVLQVENWRESK